MLNEDFIHYLTVFLRKNPDIAKHFEQYPNSFICFEDFLISEKLNHSANLETSYVDPVFKEVLMPKILEVKEKLDEEARLKAEQKEKEKQEAIEKLKEIVYGD